MSETESAGGAFNIGSQQAGVINNVRGDQRIEGDQRGAVSVTVTEAAEQMARLRAETPRLNLKGPERAEALLAIDSARAELEAPQPDRERIAAHLGHFANILVQAGVLVSAGTAVITPLHRLADWLGPLGSSLQNLLR